VRPIQAKITHDTELVGKMLPYVVIQSGAIKQKTDQDDKGDKNPTWGGEYSLPYYKDKPIYISVWDNDAYRDDLIGEITIPAYDIP